MDRARGGVARRLGLQLQRLRDEAERTFHRPRGGLFAAHPAERLSEYNFGTGVARHLFCRRCGVQSFYHPRSNPDGVGVTLYCVDEGTIADVEIRKFDGRHWERSHAATGIAACSKVAT